VNFNLLLFFGFHHTLDLVANNFTTKLTTTTTEERQ